MDKDVKRKDVFGNDVREHYGADGRLQDRVIDKQNIHGHEVREVIVNGRVAEKLVDRKDIFGNQVRDHYVNGRLAEQ